MLCLKCKISFIPRISFILCSGILMLYTAVLTAQITPAYKSFTRARGDQLDQQKQWQLKHLPTNSVLYKFGSSFIQPVGYSFSFNKIYSPKISYSALTTTSLKVYPFNSTAASTRSPGLHSYLHTNRSKYYNWQRQALWKDHFLLKDKSFLHL